MVLRSRCTAALLLPGRAAAKYAIPQPAPIAQLDRASDYESEGRVFESPWAHSGIPRGYTVLCYQNSAVVAKWLQKSSGDGLRRGRVLTVEHVERTRPARVEPRAVRRDGEADVRVPEHAAHVVQVHAGLEKQARERVPKPVRREVRGQRGGRLLEHGGERSAYVGRVGVGARRRAEDGFRHLAPAPT